MRIWILLPLLVLQPDPVDAYRNADFSQKKGQFDDANRERIALEFAIINKGSVASLRKALRDSNKDVRAFACTALGIKGDVKSGAAIAKLATDDGSPLVRCMALQALGWLRTGKAAIEAGRSDRNRDVKFMAGVAEAHLSDRTNHAKIVRDAYKEGIKESEMASAAVGKAAPEFTALDMNGRKVKMPGRKKTRVLMFQLADW